MQKEVDAKYISECHVIDCRGQ